MTRPEIKGMNKPRKEVKLYAAFAYGLEKHPACSVIRSILQSPNIQAIKQKKDQHFLECDSQLSRRA